MRSTETGMNVLKDILTGKIDPENFDMAAEAAVEGALDAFDAAGVDEVRQNAEYLSNLDPAKKQKFIAHLKEYLVPISQAYEALCKAHSLSRAEELRKAVEPLIDGLVRIDGETKMVIHILSRGEGK